MRVVKFDFETYNRTKGLGTPVHSMIEEEITDIDMIVDEGGNPTRGGQIGYALAYALMAGFIGAMFYSF